MNIGLIGTGYWGGILKPKIAALGNLTFECSGRDPSTYRDQKPDWVVVATPLGTHYDIVRHFLSQGVSVLCEKPLTAHRAQSAELYTLADEENALLYVDDVFCFRDENKMLADGRDPSTIRDIRFVWKKHGSFKDTTFNTMTYHDLSLAHQLFGHLQARELHLTRNEPDIKEFEFLLGSTRLSFHHDRTYAGKEKKIIVDGRVVDYGVPTNDALLDMMAAVFLGRVDFQKNRARALSIDNLLEKLNATESTVA